MASQKKSTPWSVEEVQTFLTLVAEERIQRELDGTTQNERVSVPRVEEAPSDTQL